MDKDFLKNINILYVEDEEEVQELTSSFLSKFVNLIVSAANGKDGLEIFKKHYLDEELKNFDLIVTDINMPKLNGLEMLAEITKIDNEVPAIVTTAHTDSMFLKQAINQRVRAYVSKPLNMHDLIDSILVVSEPKFLKDKLEALNNELKIKVEKKTSELQAILDAQDSLIQVVSDDSSFEVNQTLLDFCGYKSLDEFNQKHECISELFVEKNNYFVMKDDGLWFDEIIKLEDNKRIVMMNNTQGKEHIFRVTIKSFIFNSKHIVISFNDITDLKNYTYELEYQASHDNLTKLFNRYKLNNELDREIIRENRYNHGLSLIMIDIDDFKKVNDNYGHDTGDIVLKNIAHILKNSVRATDSVARWGGEEFMILLPETLLKDALNIAELIRTHILKYKHSVIDKALTVSIGVAQFKVNYDSLESIIKNVDIAMYEAKKTGKNKVIKYGK